MSGWTGGDLLVLNYGEAFIEKPFVSKKPLDVVNVAPMTPAKSQAIRNFRPLPDSLVARLGDRLSCSDTRPFRQDRTCSISP
jgi:hypothetical protein